MDSEDRVREYRITIRTDGLISISRVWKDQILTFPSAWNTPPALSILFYQQVLSHHETDQTGCSQISLTISLLN